MKNLHIFLKVEHVLGLTNVYFKKDRPCAACQAGKQVGSTHHNKKCDDNIKTTGATTYGPLRTRRLPQHRGSKYGLVIVDDFPASLGYSFCRINQKPKGPSSTF
jgi:hypothetical protein